MRLISLFRRGSLLAALVLLVGATLAPAIRSRAQDGIVLTLGIPTYVRDAISDKVLAEFTAANPGVTVQLVNEDTLGAPSAANDVGTHLDTVQKFASVADVVLFNGGNLVSPEATRAGYYLNLQPLIDSDSKLNAADFVPQLLHAYQWDQGTWALPLAADATLLTYDPAAFDKAKIAYPTGKWTIDDLITAVKALNVTDANGRITTPGIELYVGNNDIPLYASLIGKPVFDANGIPNPPQLDQPEVRGLFDRLKELQSLLPLQALDFGTGVIRIESILNLAFSVPSAPVRKGTLLPGGHAFLTVSGVAVSAATQHPDAAYALARFMTTRPEVNRFTSIPARVSLVGQTGGDNANNFNIRLTPELKTLLDQAVANGYTASDLRFYDFLSQGATKIQTQNLDGPAAIAYAQGEALKAQQTALDRKNDAAKVAVVATALPTADPNKGIVLKFGVTVYATSLAKKAEIQALAEQFVKNTPGIAKIDIQNGFDGVDVATGKYDCFYLPYSAVPSAALNTILNVDPYLTSDKTYDTADYIGGSLAQVQRDNKTWAIPMGISPTVMWFDPTSFANSGVPKPAYGWGIDSFKDTLTALKPQVKEGQSPFYMSGPGGEGVSLLMLIASYGGLPIDWSTNPPTVKFTDAANAAAMRQVLDLAKAKLIDYKKLGTNFGFSAGGATGDNPLYSEQLNGVNFGGGIFGGGSKANTSKFVAVTFPKGSQYQALSYSTASLYISAKAQNPAACYQWISLFAKHPELMSLMPISRTQLADPSLETQIGKPLAAVYRDVAKVLDDTNTLKIPSLFDGGANISGFVEQYWLFQAWDAYVLDDKDLDTSLKDAQSYAQAYVECAAVIAPYDPGQQKYSEYTRNFTNCAVKADPRLKSLLGGQ